MPLVSIITPLHNKGAYIEETIRSVISQTLRDWEMIIVENGSTDDGPQIARGFCDPRIRLVVSGVKGPGAARNHGLKFATGEWILFLDADDLLSPDYLEKRLSHSRINGSDLEADIIVGGWEEFSSPESGFVLRRPSGEEGGKQAIEATAIAAAPWAVHAALIRRSAAECHHWQEELDGFPSEDTAFWFPLVRKSRIAVVPDHGALYRIPNHATRNRPENFSLWVEGIAAVISRNIEVLASEAIDPTDTQCIFIMRGFEAAYCRAMAFSDNKAAAKALEHTGRWLKSCRFSGSSIILRKILGIRLFCQIRRLVKTHPSVNLR